MASYIRFAERDSPVDSEVCSDDTSFEFDPSFETSVIQVSLHSEEGDDISVQVESRRDLPLTVQLDDAVKYRSRRTKRGKRRHSELASDDDQTVASTAASKTSSLAVKRRGKAAVVYTDQLESTPSSSFTPVAQTGGDDVTEFVLVDSPSWRRAKWMDADLETTNDRSFVCSLTRLTLASLEEHFGRRITEGRSMPRRCLINLTDLEEELVAVDDHVDDLMKSLPTRNHDAPPRRLFLVVEELETLTQQSTSAFGRVTCRFVTTDIAVDILL